ncbi:hypothetical protein FACS189461_3820 [Spirochaetia bacterium]|nr:hypothetical protein FACS189461_3820 [Spirochaetia bacterium]
MSEITAEVFRELGKGSDIGDIYSISDSEKPKWDDLEKADSGKQDIPDIYKVSDSKEAPWTENSGKEGLQEASEISQYKGGSYGELKDAGYGSPKYEVHHMPADSISELPREDGPAIAMDKEDHRLTASCGRSKEACEYRQEQKELIERGKFGEAFKMDIDDIHEKFGDKYDGAIAEASEYLKKLEEEGRV